MYRGTTPTITLALDTELPLENLAELWVTFKGSTVEITKELNDSEVEVDSEHKKIIVSLSQQETLQLFNGKCEVQVRFRIGELAYASTIAKIDVERILKEGVI